MNAREQARAQALEEIGDNMADLLQLHRRCSGWQLHEHYPSQGCTFFLKKFEFEGGSVHATVQVDSKGVAKITVRDIA